ncbi:alpha/beta hydrolase fold-3 domain-containing protein [Myriangium duriaei CBS 260.36]|uniref:Alpha/beta hydrolase fold-3 domain-containing protein n=1 Tax=Myriangium duriaei CBS 260.36 TaxID=1168546 RepID=A0A9P4J1H6_9PEZI|nr:alpha/beta hydrolase fold-3 domain-containing protein [Myriangium duriaei CBS 260.36]
MCDFSMYGGASPDWLMVEQSLSTAPQSDDIRSLKATANTSREMASKAAMTAFRSQIIMKDFSVPTRDGSSLPARSYKAFTLSSSSVTTYLHLHGGGFLFGTLASEDALCARLAIASGAVVLNVCYRHTPEHKYPIAWNDAEDAFAWLHTNIAQLGGDGTRVVVGGVSAGAWLAASLTLGRHMGRLSGNWPPIAGQVLMIPCLVHGECYAPQLVRMKNRETSSYSENKNAPILPLERAQMFLNLLDVEQPDQRDLRLNPGNATLADIKGLPPTVFGVAGLDILRDEALLYAKLLTEAGVLTETHVFKGVPHGFRRFGDRLSESARWDRVMAEGVQWVLSPTSSAEFRVKTEYGLAMTG